MAKRWRSLIELKFSVDFVTHTNGKQITNNIRVPDRKFLVNRQIRDFSFVLLGGYLGNSQPFERHLV